jgi:predicted acylesterase/phospholipase RssA
MKLAGFLLALSGWAIVLAAVVLLGTSAGAFIAAGIAVQLLGLALCARAHLGSRGGRA